MKYIKDEIKLFQILNVVMTNIKIKYYYKYKFIS